MTDSYREARKSVTRAFCNKCCKDYGLEYEVNIDMDFPVENFIAFVDIPNGSGVQNHVKAWDEMWRVFDVLWREPEEWASIKQNGYS
ncbi:MAG: hypothetical protein V3W52_17080 [Syntrophobacteria bacterium]